MGGPSAPGGGITHYSNVWGAPLEAPSPQNAGNHEKNCESTGSFSNDFSVFTARSTTSKSDWLASTTSCLGTTFIDFTLATAVFLT